MRQASGAILTSNREDSLKKILPLKENISSIFPLLANRITERQRNREKIKKKEQSTAKNDRKNIK